MTKEEEIALSRFETRVRQLLLQYQELRTREKELQARLERQRLEIEQLRSENEQVRRVCSRLKTAQMLSISDGDLKEAKLTITRLIRDVDKCLALLNA